MSSPATYNPIEIARQRQREWLHEAVAAEVAGMYYLGANCRKIAQTWADQIPQEGV